MSRNNDRESGFSAAKLSEETNLNKIKTTPLQIVSKADTIIRYEQFPTKIRPKESQSEGFP